MATVEEYRRKISFLSLDRLQINASSLAESKDALQKVRDLQAELRQMKKNVNLDMKTLRAEYQQRASAAGAGSSAMIGLLGKRKLAGQVRADAKRRLNSERDPITAPYDSLKLTIDNLLIQLDKARDQLQSFVETKKAEEMSTKAAASSNYCTECGVAVADTDKFCRNCGHQLS